jgi:hypothetical protein
MDKLLKYLKSNKAVLLAAIMSLSTQLWHSVKAFVTLEPGDKFWWVYLFGILFAVSTSYAILLFTVRRKVRKAYFFLGVEVFINVISYSVLDMPLGPVLFSTLFMCIIVPITISAYSSEIDLDEQDEPSDAHLPAIEVSQLADSPKQTRKEPKIKVVDKPPLKKKFDDDSFIKAVNEMLGFDITNPKDKTGEVPESTKLELRKLWRQRKDKDAEAIKAEMKSILNQNGKALFADS